MANDDADGRLFALPARKTRKPRPHRPAKPPALRPRNPWWDALVEVWGEPSFATEERNYGAIVLELEATGVDPAEVVIRSREALSRWPQSTPRVLLSHWGQLTPRLDNRYARVILPDSVPDYFA